MSKSKEVESCSQSNSSNTTTTTQAIEIPGVMPEWLKKFATQRRGSCGFSSAEVGSSSSFSDLTALEQQANQHGSNAGSGPGSIHLPKIKVNLGMVSNPSDSTLNAGVFSFKKTDEDDPSTVSLHQFLESQSRRGSVSNSLDEAITMPSLPKSSSKTELAPIVELRNPITKIVEVENFPVLTVDPTTTTIHDVRQEETESIFKLDDEPTISANTSPSKQKLEIEQPHFSEGSESLILSTLMTQKWAQNWFFQSANDEDTQDHRRDINDKIIDDNLCNTNSKIPIHLRINTGSQKNLFKEMNTWAPQNL